MSHSSVWKHTALVSLASSIRGKGSFLSLTMVNILLLFHLILFI